MRPWVLCCVVVFTGSSLGCGRTCGLNAEVGGACGVVIGDAEVRLGDSRQAVEDALGPADSVRDLGALGAQFHYGSHGLGGLYDGPEGVVTSVVVAGGYGGQTEAGIGIGSTLASASTAYPDARVEPYSGALIVDGQGLALSVEGDLVTSIGVFAAIIGE